MGRQPGSEFEIASDNRNERSDVNHDQQSAARGFSEKKRRDQLSKEAMLRAYKVESPDPHSPSSSAISASPRIVVSPSSYSDWSTLEDLARE